MHKADKRVTYKKEVTALDYIHEYDIDPEKREIYLFGREEFVISCDTEDSHPEPGIDYTIANRFIRNLRMLQGLSADSILIHMKTCGGDWVEGMAIYQAILACPNYVTIINYSHARSMSSLIFQAADWRAMLPYSTFMFHDGTYVFEGTVKQMHTEHTQAKVAAVQMMDIYLDKAEKSEFFAGKSRKQIETWMRQEMDKKEDVYLPAKLAVAMNFADIVFGADGQYDWTKLRG